jgi:hypothetical protein
MTTIKKLKQATALQSYTFKATTEAHFRSMDRHPRPNGLSVFLTDAKRTVFVELLFPRHWPTTDVLSAIMDRIWDFNKRNGKSLQIESWGGGQVGKQEVKEDVAFLTLQLRETKKHLGLFG